MFGRRYFGPRYFGQSYFGPHGEPRTVGDLLATEADDTLSAAGALSITGGANVTEADDTLAAFALRIDDRLFRKARYEAPVTMTARREQPPVMTARRQPRIFKAQRLAA